jgi:hypothetical protein
VDPPVHPERGVDQQVPGALEAIEGMRAPAVPGVDPTVTLVANSILCSRGRLQRPSPGTASDPAGDLHQDAHRAVVPAQRSAMSGPIIPFLQ